MSGATLERVEQLSTMPPWPQNRIKSFETTLKGTSKARSTRVLLAAPAVSDEEQVLYGACFINDLGWWSVGMQALYRTLLTMGYSTIAEAAQDRESFKEAAAARIEETERHIIKGFNLSLYLEGVRQTQSTVAGVPVERVPLQWCVIQLREGCHNRILLDAREVMQDVVPALEKAASPGGKLARHAEVVASLKQNLAELVAKLEKSKRAAETLSQAAK